MYIPNTLHRFDDERSLLITTGKQIGKLYFAYRGKIVDIASVQVPKTIYSDREGFFARSGKGKTFGTGSVYEPKDTAEKKKFLKAFTGKVKDVLEGRKVQAVYLFSPNYEIRELKDGLPRTAREAVRFSFMGNFVKFGPMELVRKITERERLKSKNGYRGPAETKILLRPKTRSRK